MNLPQTRRTLPLTLLVFVAWMTLGFGQNFGDQFQISLENALERLVDIPPPPDKINCIQEDTLGNIWIGTNSGLYKYDGQQYEHIYDREEGLLSISIRSLYLDEKGDIWIGNLGYGLQKFNPYSKQFTTYEIPIDLKEYPSRPYHISDSYDEDHFLLAMDRSFGLFSLKENKFTELIHEGFSKPNVGLGFVRSIEPDPLDKDTWWLGTTNGLFSYDRRDTSFAKLEHVDKHFNGLVRTFCFDNEMRMIFSDDVGQVYMMDTSRQAPRLIADLSAKKQSKRLIPDVIAIIGSDIMIGNRTSETVLIKNYNTTPSWEVQEPLANFVTAIFVDHADRLWLGHRKGFSVYNPKYDITTKYNLKKHLPRSSIILSADQWQKNSPIYVAVALNDGLFVLDPVSDVISIERPKSVPKKKSFMVKGLTFDENGFLWVSSNRGLFRYDTEEKIFSKQALIVDNEKIKNLGKIQYHSDGIMVMHAFRPHRLVYFNSLDGSTSVVNIIGENDCKVPLLRQFRDFDITKNGDVWIAGRPYILKYVDECIKEYRMPDSIGIEILGAKCIDTDEAGNLFLGYGTRGLVKLTQEETRESIVKYGLKDGMPSERILKIENDAYGATWIASGSGLIYSANLKSFQLIALPNIGDEDYFNDPRSLKKMHSGDVALGGNHSVIALDVKKANENLDREKPQLQSISWGEKEKIQLQGKRNERITIPYDNESIFIHFSDYDFGRPDSPTFLYRLANKSKSWQHLTKEEITFYNLSYGEYNLEVTPNLGEYVDVDLISRLNFYISPPWYLKWWSIVLWGAIGILLLYAFFRYLLQRQMVAQKLAHVESVKDLQNKLFTNITHELRTPLSLIIGGTRNMSKESLVSDKKAIINNAKILKNYVDQLLDLSSIDVGKFTLKKEQIDVILHLKLIIEAFEIMAKNKGIIIHQLFDAPRIYMDMDLISFRKIVTNLVHNALKFTEGGGHIYVSASETQGKLNLSIRDTGEGIKEEHLPYIFDRYYKTFDLEENLGSGIGMALTKELVEMLEGEIDVESHVGKGTNFTILFPIYSNETRRTETDEISSIEYTSTPKETLYQDPNLDLLIVVEDNVDMNNYIASIFRGEYRILQKYDGQEGLETILSSLPQIVISDVMMPKMNGFQMVHQMKDDWRICDIPVVLLTAKADKSSKLEGLNEGADAYLPKPFDEDELHATVANLVGNRRRIVDKEQNLKNDKQVQGKFESRVYALVNEFLSDPQLSVDFIARKLDMSRSNLFREMKDEIGITPSKFIKKVKLQKAIELLEKTELRIGDIASQSGFADPSYFTRIFKSELGISPQEFRKQR